MNSEKMRKTHLPYGVSDPLSFTCTCPASTTSFPPSSNIKTGGLVLLFYRYFTSLPPLPSTYQHLASDPTHLSSFHRCLTRKYHLGGKIRVATEGFNITVAGTRAAIEGYIQDLLPHWSLDGLDLSADEKRRAFFKPSEGGCACVFPLVDDGGREEALSEGGGGKRGVGGESRVSIRICAEITPMGVTDYIPRDWGSSIEELSPEVFHDRCINEEVLLLDVRNHYESRIGYFIDPKTGREALRPEIRRFGQWPGFVRRAFGESQLGGLEEQQERDGHGEERKENRQILTYCTGGIRCEKGARFLAENLSRGGKVCTLAGGIAAYLDWMDEEIRAGRKEVRDSLFKGRNYVFDARGSTGLRAITHVGIRDDGEENTRGEAEDQTIKPVSECHICHIPSDRLSRCRSTGCHLILVLCPSCETTGDPRCCSDCKDIEISLKRHEQHEDDLADQGKSRRGNRPICECERQREARLWGGEDARPARLKGWKVAGRRKEETRKV